MKKIEKKLEKKLVGVILVAFALTVVLGFGAGYYSQYQKARLVYQLYKEQELYKYQTMEQLNYRIRYLLAASDDQVSPGN